MEARITRKAMAEAKRVAERESSITRKLVMKEVKRIELAINQLDEKVTGLLE